MAGLAPRDAITDALGYWERRRLAYNLLLVVVVAGVYWLAPVRAAPGIDVLLQLFVLAVIANVLYCAAYVVDVAVQCSGFRATWLRRRWLLLAGGSLFAAVLAQFVARGLFGWPVHG